VGIPDPRRRIDQYPHALSGGMRQRVAIAMALACDPDLLIADEATTALDVTTQQQILDLLQDIQRERHMALIMVSHDLAVVASRTERIAVMYAGRLAETGPTGTLFADWRHRYTEALLGSVPRLGQAPHTPLRAIGGQPAEPVGRPVACRFAPRCLAATDRCRHERPALEDAGTPGHRFACFVPAAGAADLAGGAGAGGSVAASAVASAALVSQTAASNGAAADGATVGTSAAGEASNGAAADRALLRVEHLVCEFPVRGGKVQAVSDVSFSIMPGETLGLVGESGCGKTTIARAIAALPGPTGGRVLFEGADLASLATGFGGSGGADMRAMRARVQIVFQDPIASLNPRRKVRQSVAEALRIQGADRAEAESLADDALADVGLVPALHGDKKPFQLSGGQCQRVAIARSMVLKPELLICDEPVSALDVSVRAQVLNLLEQIKASRRLTMLFVSHDLGVVRHISDRVAVMYLGKIVEIGDVETLYQSPAHPYTRALIDAVPDPDATGEPAPALAGQLPSPLAPPSGCRFRTRCPLAQQVCAETEPALRQVPAGQEVACHFPLV
jgi:peptide/nickel transport system ATP-binding protein